jgi:hypothetical protein
MSRDGTSKFNGATISKFQSRAPNQVASMVLCDWGACDEENDLPKQRLLRISGAMQRPGPIAASSILAATLLFLSPASAQEVLKYNVEHPKYGNIGTYTNTVSQNGDSTQVQTELHIAVKMIGISMFHQDATRQEHWDSQRLVGFQSKTDDNGTEISVIGKAADNGFDIQSSAIGAVVAPPQVHPSNPWAPFVLKTDLMMSSKTGKVLPVVVTDTGEVTVTFDGQPVRAHQWFVDDDKHQVVWIDDKGVVIAFQTNEQGDQVNFVLARSGTAEAAPAAAPTPAASPYANN